jgi:hypothetical protein
MKYLGISEILSLNFGPRLASPGADSKTVLHDLSLVDGSFLRPHSWQAKNTLLLRPYTFCGATMSLQSLLGSCSDNQPRRTEELHAIFGSFRQRNARYFF